MHALVAQHPTPSSAEGRTLAGRFAARTPVPRAKAFDDLRNAIGRHGLLDHVDRADLSLNYTWVGMAVNSTIGVLAMSGLGCSRSRCANVHNPEYSMCDRPELFDASRDYRRSSFDRLELSLA